MTVEPFELIENYARHHDAYVRRNVAIAISTLPDEPSVAALVDMATSDPDEKVRETAEQRLAMIDPSGAPLLRLELVKRLQSDDPAKKVVANAFAGRLHRRGFDLRPPEDRLRNRLRTMWSEGRFVSVPWTVARDAWRRFRQAGISRRFSLRVVWAGLVGSLPPAALLMLYLAFTLRPSLDVHGQFATLTVPLVLLLTLRIGRRDQPLMLQWDEPAAIFRDVFETGLWTLVLATIPATLFWMVQDTDLKPAVWLGLASAAVIATAYAAVHLSSAAVRYQSSGGTAARLIRYSISLTFGISVLTGALLVARRFEMSDVNATMVEGLWLCAIPGCGAVALVLARLDSISFGAAASNRRPSRRHHLAAAALAMPGVALCSFWLWTGIDAYLLPGRWFDDALGGVDWPALSGSTRTVPLSWRGPESVYRFRLPFPQSLELAVTTPGGEVATRYTSGPTVALWSPRPRGGESVVDDQAGCPWGTSMDQRPIENSPRWLLAAGCYELRIGARSYQRTLPAALQKRTRKGRAEVLQLQDVRLAVNTERAVWARPDQLSQAFPVSSTSPPLAWTASRGRPIDIELQSPAAVGVLRLVPYREQFYGGAVTISKQRSPVRFENGGTLNPGVYSIDVSPGTGLIPSGYAMFSKPSADASGGQRESWLKWTVTEAPSSFRFKLPKDDTIVGELKVPGGQDMMLELVRLDRQVLFTADDPEIIRTVLGAGEYDLVVKTYAQRGQPRPKGEKLSSPVELFLDRAR